MIRAIGERRQEAVGEDWLAVARESRRAVEQPAGGHRLPRRRAEGRGKSRRHSSCNAARRQPREQDGRAGGEVDADADRLDHPGASMAQNGRQRVAAVPSIALRSEWQTPAARRRTSTSPGRAGPAPAPRARSRRPGAPRTAARSSGARPRPATPRRPRPPPAGHRFAALGAVFGNSRRASSERRERQWWPGSTSRSGGLCSTQTSPMNRGQRVWNTHPDGGAAWAGISPRRRSPRPLARPADRGQQRLGVRALRRAEHRSDWPSPPPGRGTARRSDRRDSGRPRGRGR